MSTLLVTYDLNKEVNRPDILKEIKKSQSWAKLSESSYAIETYETPQQVFSRLSPYLDDNDNCYIITLNAPYSGRGPKEVNEWLAKRLTYQRA
ncbi:hypothetical protein U8P80_16180 [Rhizobium beringeri]|jgi:hypothetical protein|nr:hypothetical protein U8P80_16180 [Rhizobium beringeri]WSH13268.1 hypothetical protein U8P74_16180 [Rhizobium beringeri]